MVWDFRVSRARPMPFYWPSWSLIFCLLLFYISPLLFYGLVVWGWGLRTHMVLIALSQPCITNFFNNNNYFFPYLRLSSYLLRLFILFHSCSSHARVFRKTRVNELSISYSHTECYLIFSRGEIVLALAEASPIKI